MAIKKEDRRIQRTRALLHEALLDLMIEKGYEATTIQDIIDRANVGRSTFYTHFEDKEQLLISNINQLRDFLKQQRVVVSYAETAGGFRFGFSLAMLQHIQSHKRVYRATVGKQSGALVIHHMQRMLAELVKEEIGALILHTQSRVAPLEVLVDFVVNTFLTLVAWWMDQQTPCSALEMDDMFHKLTLSGIGAQFGNETQ